MFSLIPTVITWRATKFQIGRNVLAAIRALNKVFECRIVVIERSRRCGEGPRWRKGFRTPATETSVTDSYNFYERKLFSPLQI